MNRDFHEMDQMLSRCMDAFAGIPTRIALHAIPIDIRSYPDKFMIDANLPGYKKDEISITFENGALTISATHKVEEHKCDCGDNCQHETCQCNHEPEYKYVCKERMNGTATRTITMNRAENLDLNKMTADFVDGVLTITINKKPIDEIRKTININ